MSKICFAILNICVFLLNTRDIRYGCDMSIEYSIFRSDWESVTHKYIGLTGFHNVGI